jgi:arylsulfatase A-like enzyme
MYYSILRYWQGEIADEDIPPHAREMIAKTYRDAVRSVDGFIDALREATAACDPITIFLSDHGEALGEHGNFGHKQTLFEENIRVPFFVHDAGVSGTVDEQVPLRALPKLLENVAKTDGFDPHRYTRQFVVSQTENNRMESVRTPHWKLVRDGESETLYNLRKDPDESEDVQSTFPTVASSLGSFLDRHDATQAEKMQLGDATEAVLAETQL